MFRKALIALGLLLLAAAPGHAQSSCPYIVQGAQLTAAQWNFCFSQKQDVLGFTPLNRAGGVMTGPLITIGSTVSGAGFRVSPGTAPTSPVDGDMWTTTAGIFVRINGSTVPLAGPSSDSFAATAPLAVSFPAGIVTYALNLDSNFTTSGGNLAFSTISSGSLLANCTGSTAEPTSQTFTACLDRNISSTQGAILYRNSTTWVSLGPGTFGQFLQTGGAAANPSWAPASGGSVTNVATGTGAGGGPITTTGTITANVGCGGDRLSKSAAYTLVNGDKWKNIGLGGAAFYALTLTSGSGYDANYSACVVNEDTTRGKTILRQVTTSASSLTIGTGSKAFTISSGLYFPVGQRIRAWSLADPTKWMSGVVLTYASTTLTLTVDATASSGTFTDWQVGFEDILWPLQAWIIFNDNNLWAKSGLDLWVLPPQGATWNVDATNGLNNTDGLGLTTGAFKTYQGGLNKLCASVNANQHQVILQGPAGPAASATENINLCTVVGAPTDYRLTVPILRGASGGNPTNFQLNCGASTCIAGVQSQGWRVEGFSMVGTGTCLQADNGSLVYGGNNIYDCSTFHLVASYGSRLETLDNWTSFGTTVTLMFSTVNSTMIINGNTVSFAGTATQTNYAIVDEASTITTVGVTFSGSTTNTHCIIAQYGGGFATSGISQPCTGADTIDAATFAWKR